MTNTQPPEHGARTWLDVSKPLLAVLVISLGATFAAWRYEYNRVGELDDVRFTRASQSIQNDIQATMKAYGQFLRGGVGLFHASDNVTRSDWARYVADLSFAETYPGIQGISYNAVLHGPDERAAFVQQVRETDLADFSIRPESTHDISVPVLYLEPLTERNARAIGFDIYSEDLRRAAIERAVGTGQISMTAKITLVQENTQAGGDDVQAGVLLMLPVYNTPPDTNDSAVGYENVDGMIVSVFRMGNLIEAVIAGHTGDFGTELGVRLYDAGTPDPESLLYASTGWDENPQRTFTNSFDVFGQEWTLTTATTAAYDQRTQTASPAIIALAGTLMSLLLAGIMWGQAMRTRDSEVVARNTRAHADHVQLLLHEVNHRSKNLLAVILAISRQTDTSNVKDYAANLQQRIQGLAASQDLLVHNEWKDSELEDVVMSQLGPFQSLDGEQIQVSGPPVKIAAAEAQTLGMAFHELATNARKYGALSSIAGKVHVTWSMDNGETLLLSWVETGGPTVKTPETQGFGTIVLNSVLENSMGAQVETRFAPEGFEWHIRWPYSAKSEP